MIAARTKWSKSPTSESSHSAEELAKTGRGGRGRNGSEEDPAYPEASLSISGIPEIEIPGACVGMVSAR